MMIFTKLVYLSSVISLKWQWRLPINCYLGEITELKYTSLIKIIIKKENCKWHLEAFASELVIYIVVFEENMKIYTYTFLWIGLHL